MWCCGYQSHLTERGLLGLILDFTEAFLCGVCTFSLWVPSRYSSRFPQSKDMLVISICPLMGMNWNCTPCLLPNDSWNCLQTPVTLCRITIDNEWIGEISDALNNLGTEENEVIDWLIFFQFDAYFKKMISVLTCSSLSIVFTCSKMWKQTLYLSLCQRSFQEIKKENGTLIL